MDDDLLPPDATAEEIEELAIENARCNVPQLHLIENLTQSCASKKAGPLRFTDAMDTAMYKAMILAHRQGLGCEPAGFKSLAWRQIVAAVQAKVTTDHIVVKKQCEGRKATQKAKWAGWKRLGIPSGWGFDHETGLFKARPDQWEREIAVNLSLLDVIFSQY